MVLYTAGRRQHLRRRLGADSVVAKYIIRFKANPEAWPADPAEVLLLWEGVIGGAGALLESGTLTELNWTSNLAG